MDGEDVYERVAREHPELTGRDRLYAIRELKQQQKAKQRLAKKAGRECPACHDEVQPVTPAAFQLLAGCLTLLALAAFAASIVAAVHPFADATVHGGWGIVLWPASAVDGWTHPRLLAVLVAFFTLYAASWVLGKANERADRKARCPKCSQPMPPPKP
ncbi:hypothetical protein ABZ608_42185 [Streptomyces sp. NPDC013172]|uniref:Uncharacterized protein n=1 Tax=Streptomyces atriruber TaxID=545121 RepID=A0ABV3C2U3_9ACTN